MKYEVKDVVQMCQSKKRVKYVFFWGHTEKPGEVTKACFSQWYGCQFTVDGITYDTAEQYMMAQKAMIFGDKAVFQEIMAAKHPKQYKALGRKIVKFVDSIWDERKYGVVVRGNYAKFSQNPELKEFLLSTKTRILVEASPYDSVWGIGLAADDQNIENPLNWKGKNLLGFALMEVRDMLANPNMIQSND